MNQLRSELELPLPRAMARLPIHRGYPVPWFVPIIKGEPEFRAMDAAKFIRATKEKLCWVCGDSFRAFGFTAFYAFAIGPMCAINRISSEPPSHRECASWSARNCPFLSRPQARRRDTGDLDIQEPAGIMIDRNPGVTLIWPCSEYRVFRADNNGKPLIQIGDPTAPLSWFREGRQATRAEIEESIRTGLPAFEATLEREAEPAAARRELDRRIEIAYRLLPA